ncbi:hypothetical protein B0H14DRAFT_2671079, partial [Mycena olivaceomarginata]
TLFHRSLPFPSSILRCLYLFNCLAFAAESSNWRSIRPSGERHTSFDFCHLCVAPGTAITMYAVHFPLLLRLRFTCHFLFATFR